MANANAPLEVLHRLSRAIARAAKLDEIYQLILEEAAAAVGVERASIMKYDRKHEALRVVAARGLEKELWNAVEVPIGEGISGRVFQTKEPLLIKDLRVGRPDKSPGQYKTHSLMTAPVTCFPMQMGEAPLGVINMTDKKDGSSFTEQDLKLLTTIADQVAAYLHMSDLLEQLQDAEKAKRQLEIARMIQEKLLPKRAPRMKGIDLAGRLMAAERVGADYYDYLAGPKSKSVGVAVADVSGHDVGGALLASAFRTCLKAESLEKHSPATLVEAINQTLFDDLFSAEQFISMVYLSYQPSSHTLHYSNAGHNPPLLWHARKKEAEWLFTGDCLLGIEPIYHYHEKKRKLEKGDVVVVYTDGLTEARGSQTRGKNNKCFGTVLLEETMHANAGKSAQEILDQIFSRWQEFVEGEPPQDDVTVVVMKSV